MFQSASRLCVFREPDLLGCNALRLIFLKAEQGFQANFSLCTKRPSPYIAATVREQKVMNVTLSSTKYIVPEGSEHCECVDYTKTTLAIQPPSCLETFVL